MTKVIGIDASRAFAKERTGIEEYSFQVLKKLTSELEDAEVFLYTRNNEGPSFDLPKNWKIKKIKWPFFWTQLGLSLEMFFHPVDVLFVPSHVVPIIHPKNTIATIHGLEYEFFPEGYSFWDRIYMRLSIKASCRWAKKIVAVSENTKKDLIDLYKVPEDKIMVIYEGYNNFQFILPQRDPAEVVANSKSYLLFVGRLEARKNVIGIVKAFEILKEKYKISHQLILAGKFGHGADVIRGFTLSNKDIVELGFVSEEKKQELLKGADVFLFPSFYEGFGLPILEAQRSGVPVVTSNVSSMPEIAGDGALLANPNSPEEIAKAVFCLISDKILRDDIIKKGQENTKRFSWEECSVKIAKIIAQ
jgi:glycosyltransferase involved in cell wall biosynthesis